jgi:hypothetical protein
MGFVLVLSMLLAACAPTEVIKTVEVGKEVIKTVEVERKKKLSRPSRSRNRSKLS